MLISSFEFELLGGSTLGLDKDLKRENPYLEKEEWRCSVSRFRRRVIRGRDEEGKVVYGLYFRL